MHVLQVLQPQTGGVPAYVEALGTALMERGHRVSVACPPGTTAAGPLARAGARVHPISVDRAPKPAADLRAVRALAARLRGSDVDLVHSHSSKAGVLGGIAARRTGRPSVYTPHGWSFDMAIPLAARAVAAGVETMVARAAHSAIVAVSEAERKSGERWRVAAPQRLRLVHTGLRDAPPPDRARARRGFGLDDEEFAVAWIGRTGPQKRAEDLAVVAAQVKGRVRVMALGDGLAAAHDLSEALRKAGVDVLAQGTPPATVLAAADALLLTSAWESFPLVVLEAMQAGLPVVATAVGGVSEQVVHGRTGLLARPGDTQSLARHLETLTRDGATATGMGREGRGRFESRFSFERMVAGVEDVYREVLGETRS